MNDVQQRNAAKHFADFWKGKGYEKGDTQKFWLSLLGEVLGVEHPAEYITFEDQVHLDHTSFMDGYIPVSYTHLHARLFELGCQGAVARFVALEDAFGLDGAVFHLVELELARAAKVLKDVPIFIGNRDLHV